MQFGDSTWQKKSYKLATKAINILDNCYANDQDIPRKHIYQKPNWLFNTFRISRLCYDDAEALRFKHIQEIQHANNELIESNSQKEPIKKIKLLNKLV